MSVGAMAPFETNDLKTMLEISANIFRDIDYQTQERTLKDSAYWYSEVIATNGAKIHENQNG